MNSAVGPIFNEKYTEKWNLWDPWTVYPCTVYNWLGQIVRLEQKKIKIKIKKRIENPRQNVDVRLAQSKHSLNAKNLAFSISDASAMSNGPGSYSVSWTTL